MKNTIQDLIEAIRESTGYQTGAPNSANDAAWDALTDMNIGALACIVEDLEMQQASSDEVEAEWAHDACARVKWVLVELAAERAEI